MMPAWQAQIEMGQANVRALDPNAQQMRDLRDYSGSTESIEEVRKRFDRIVREYRTWPLRRVETK